MKVRSVAVVDVGEPEGRVVFEEDSGFTVTLAGDPVELVRILVEASWRLSSEMRRR